MASQPQPPPTAGPSNPQPPPTAEPSNPQPPPTAGPSSSSQPPAPPPVTLPPRPEGPEIRYPEAPMYPPTNPNILDALKYHTDAISRNDEQTIIEAAKYQHAILTQAVAASQPDAIAPPWFHGAMQAYMKEIRTEVEQGLKATLDATRRNLKTTETRLRQHTEICIKDVEDEIRGLKNEVVPGLRMALNRVRHGHARLEIVPFPNGDDPTTMGLPGLQSIEEIEDLTDEDVATYLTRYGITELPTRSSAHLTQRERKNLLRGLVGAPFP